MCLEVWGRLYLYSSYHRQTAGGWLLQLINPLLSVLFRFSFTRGELKPLAVMCVMCVMCVVICWITDDVVPADLTLLMHHSLSLICLLYAVWTRTFLSPFDGPHGGGETPQRVPSASAGKSSSSSSSGSFTKARLSLLKCNTNSNTAEEAQ